jgi:kynureninase
MAHAFRPAPDAGAFQISSIPQLSAAPLRASLAMVAEAGIHALRAKSLRLSDFMMELVDALEPLGYRVGTPREHDRRGGHVAVEHDAEADRICKALKAAGVVPDFRVPNIIRLAPVPLYNSFHEAWQAIGILRDIVETRRYEQYEKGRGLIA